MHIAVLRLRGQPTDDDQATRRRDGAVLGERRHFSQRLEPEAALRNAHGRTIDERLRDQAPDGVDIG